MVCIGPGATADVAGSEYAGGASSLSCLGRRVGVVIGKGFVLPFEGGPGPAIRGGKDPGWIEGDFFDFLERILNQLLGILSLDEVLFCEQEVGVNESDMFAGANENDYKRGKSLSP